jgi:serine/threonine protein kinase/Flp pilus assembly protein TadD
MKCPKCNFENPDTQSFCGNCGTQLIPPKNIPAQTRTIETPFQELSRGSLFANRYEIIEELGTGGMGKVYRVEDTKAKEEIALKLIKPEIAADKKTIDRFRNELTTARKIRHKNICGMYDLGEDKGSYYITMEYVTGEDLKSLIRRVKQIPVGTAISITEQICEGLSEAHKLGVVHRDLKPSNIMIDKDGNARIMDFGIARSLKGKGITGAGVMIGTPEYMSPEQVEGKDVDHRSDLYSLGVILYEMVTGRVPFEGDTPFTVGVKHKSEIPQNPKEINSQIPDTLNNVIFKCLEKEKEKRYQSIGELRSELENIEKGIPKTERIGPVRKPLTSREITVQFSLKKLFIPVFVIIGVIMIGVALWHPWSEAKKTPVPSDKPSLAVVYFENVSGDESLDGWRTGIASLLTTDLMQSKLIHVLPDDRVFSILKKYGLQDEKKYTTEDLIKIADEGGVNHTINGSYIRAGGTIIVTMVLQKPHTGEVINSHKVTCRGEEEITPRIDELTRLVKLDLELSKDQIASDPDKKIESITTNFPEAFKHYQKGLDALYRLFTEKAHDHFQKAVEIDPTFAMAHVYLALSSGIFAVMNPLADLSSQRRSLELARKYAYKVTDRERQAIDGWRALYDREFRLAYDIAQELVEEYPDFQSAFMLLQYAAQIVDEKESSLFALKRYLELDPNFGPAYNGIAYIHFALGNRSEAVSAVKKAVDLLPDDWNSYDSAWEIHMKAGLFDDAIHYCEEALKRIPDDFYFHIQIGISLLLKGLGDEAREKFHLYVDLVPDSLVAMTRLTACSFLFEGKYQKAHAEFEKAIRLAQKGNNPRSEMFRHLDLGKMLAVQGKYDLAIKEFTQGEKLSWETYDKTFNPIPTFAKYLICRTLVKKGDFSAAQSQAEKIKFTIEQENFDDFYLDFYYLLLGELEAAQKNGSAVQECLEKTSGITKRFSPHYWDLAAAVLALNGENEEAIKKYQDLYGSVDTRSLGMGDYFDFFRESSRADYHIAKIYEKMGNSPKAIQNYEKFLSLWKDADPGIAEVEDARKRLEGLR